MSVSNIGTSGLPQHHHHKHQAGAPVTFQDPATTSNASGPATTLTDINLPANQLAAASTSAPKPDTDGDEPAPASSEPGVGTTVDKKA